MILLVVATDGRVHVLGSLGRTRCGLRADLAQDGAATGPGCFACGSTLRPATGTGLRLP